MSFAKKHQNNQRILQEHAQFPDQDFLKPVRMALLKKYEDGLDDSSSSHHTFLNY